MRKIRKRVKHAGAFALTLALVALTAVVAARPAAAIEGEPIVYEAKPGSTAKWESTIPMGAANDAGGVFHEPGLCATSPTCTEIPLTIKLPPDFDPDTTDFVVLVTVSWNVAGQPDQNPTGRALNDLDMYVYDMNAIDEETGEEEPAVVAQSATGTMPEIAKMFSPTDKHDYRIIVSNFAGPNSGFTVELSYKDFAFEPPDEGEPIGGAGGRGSDPVDDGGDDPVVSDEPSTSDDLGGDLAAPPLGGGESPALGLPDADDDFSDGFSLPPAAGAGRTPSLFGEDEIAAEAGPVAGTVLAAWLGVAPLALLAATIAFILKRRPPALSMAFPTGPSVRADGPADA